MCLLKDAKKLCLTGVGIHPHPQLLPFWNVDCQFIDPGQDSPGSASVQELSPLGAEEATEDS